MKKYISILFFIFASLLFFTSVAYASVLEIRPQAGSYILGSTFEVSIVLDTQGEAINTIEAEVLFPSDKLQIVNPALGKSIVQIWASPPTFSNTEGRIYFVGGIPTPGVTTAHGIVQTFSFRAISPGSARLLFGENTSVLANDGNGSETLRNKSTATFTIVLPPSEGPDVFSPTHPVQGDWYNGADPILRWSSNLQSEGFSFVLDTNETTNPDQEIETIRTETVFENIESGIWYFHIREKAGGSWSGTTHFMMYIDTISPAPFAVNISPSERTAQKDPVVRFLTTDSLSGMDHFELKVVPLREGPTENSFFAEVTSPFQFSALAPGRYEVAVRAYDVAGNFHDESVTVSILTFGLAFITPEGLDLGVLFAPWNFLIPIFAIGVVILFVFVVEAMVRHGRHKKGKIAYYKNKKLHGKPRKRNLRPRKIL